MKGGREETEGRRAEKRELLFSQLSEALPIFFVCFPLILIILFLLLKFCFITLKPQIR